jgi:hypothetical protein
MTPSSVLDVGCGVVRSLDWFLEMGVEAVGLEGLDIGIKHTKNPQYILQKDFNEPVDLNRRFDVVWCFEARNTSTPISRIYSFNL